MTNSQMEAPRTKTLSRNQKLGVWGGVGGAVIGGTSWLIAMAVMGKDWMTVLLTIALDIVVIILFGRLCLQHAKSRFLYMALMLAILTTHCLLMYWWRLDLWRSELNLTHEVLASQKKTVTFTVSAMTLILLAQLFLMHIISRKPRRTL